jgi:tripartite-type tricarboxylate transporter receptor subunit TctC
MENVRRGFRVLLTITAAVLAALGCMGIASAEGFPTKPVKLIVPYGVGTASDMTARAAAQRLSEIWKQSIVVENMTGAAGVIGTQAIAKANPDGYTIGLLASNHPMNVALYPKLPYDPLRDLRPLAHVSFNQFVFCVNPGVSAKTLQEFIALVKSRPDAINYASSGNGGSPHLASAKLAHMAGLRLVHIPYRTNGAAVTDLVAGRVEMMGTSISVMLPFIKSGQLRPLAVSGDMRSPLLPDVPTVSEAGVPGYSMKNWNGFVSPAGIPDAIAQQIQRDLFRVFQDPKFVEQLVAQGSEIELLPPEQFGRRISDEISLWKEIVRVTGAKID